LAFLDKMTYYQHIRIKKCFLKNPRDGVSVELLFRKNLPKFFFNLLFFQKNHLFKWKNLYSLIVANFLKIKGKKSAILDCAAILKDFQKRSFRKS
jgi:hypothetical protein